MMTTKCIRRVASIAYYDKRGNAITIVYWKNDEDVRKTKEMLKMQHLAASL